MTRIKHLIFSNPFRTERNPINNNRVLRSWDVVIGRLGEAGPIVEVDTSFKTTMTLRKHGIQICSRCGYMQPFEIIECKNCAQI